MCFHVFPRAPWSNWKPTDQLPSCYDPRPKGHKPRAAQLRIAWTMSFYSKKTCEKTCHSTAFPMCSPGKRRKGAKTSRVAWTALESARVVDTLNRFKSLWIALMYPCQVLFRSCSGPVQVLFRSCSGPDHLMKLSVSDFDWFTLDRLQKLTGTNELCSKLMPSVNIIEINWICPSRNISCSPCSLVLPLSYVFCLLPQHFASGYSSLSVPSADCYVWSVSTWTMSHEWTFNWSLEEIDLLRLCLVGLSHA